MINKVTKKEKSKMKEQEKIKKDTIKIEYLLGGWNPQGWEGSIQEAMNIALGEIFEHAGGGSPAYVFTNAVFKYFSSKQ